jgi:hypothetical protein
MRSTYDLHGVFDVTPFLGFVSIALGFTGLRVSRCLRNRLQAVLLKHLPRDGMNLQLGCHGALLQIKSSALSGERDLLTRSQPTLIRLDSAAQWEEHEICRHRRQIHAQRRF